MLWRPAEPLVLASRSAVRRLMLEAAGLPVDIRPAEIDERALEQTFGSAHPPEIASRLAAAKAGQVAAALQGRIVLGADQTLSCDGRAYFKPEGPAAARAQLASLRGRSHELHAAVAVVANGAAFEHCATARLTMRDFSDDFLDRYIALAGAAATASVGGYQLEGIGIHLFERIEGDYFTILGLPLLPLLDFLRTAGYVAA
jgi:septum formation protein